jgi:hypothetical protein
LITELTVFWPAKPQASQYGEPELRSWYRPLDLLPDHSETVIDADSVLDDSVDRILRESGLASTPAHPGQ